MVLNPYNLEVISLSNFLVLTSDNSDQSCQQLEISKRFNPHEISNFPTLSHFSVTTPFSTFFLTLHSLG